MASKTAELATATLREIKADIVYYKPAWEGVITTTHLDRWRKGLDAVLGMIATLLPPGTIAVPDRELAALRAVAEAAKVVCEANYECMVARSNRDMEDARDQRHRAGDALSDALDALDAIQPTDRAPIEEGRAQ